MIGKKLRRPLSVYGEHLWTSSEESRRCAWTYCREIIRRTNRLLLETVGHPKKPVGTGRYIRWHLSSVNNRKPSEIVLPSRCLIHCQSFPVCSQVPERYACHVGVSWLGWNNCNHLISKWWGDLDCRMVTFICIDSNSNLLAPKIFTLCHELRRMISTSENTNYKQTRWYCANRDVSNSRVFQENLSKKQLRQLILGDFCTYAVNTCLTNKNVCREFIRNSSRLTVESFSQFVFTLSINQMLYVKRGWMTCH